jgi:hypothetical protein
MVMADKLYKIIEDVPQPIDFFLHPLDAKQTSSAGIVVLVGHFLDIFRQKLKVDLQGGERISNLMGQTAGKLADVFDRTKLIFHVIVFHRQIVYARGGVKAREGNEK